MEPLPISSDSRNQTVDDVLEIFGGIENEHVSICHGEQETVRSGMQWSKWVHFCQQVETKSVQPTCVIDFPYADKKGKLKLQGDDRLLMRMYCFSYELKGDKIRIAVHVHTSLRWGDRNSISLAKRIQLVTSVNVRYARKLDTQKRIRARCSGPNSSAFLTRNTEKMERDDKHRLGMGGCGQPST